MKNVGTTASKTRCDGVRLQKLSLYCFSFLNEVGSTANIWG